MTTLEGEALKDFLRERKDGVVTWVEERDGDQIVWKSLTMLGDPVIEKDADGNEKMIATFIASDESVDRDGDIIRVAGWNLKNFKKNGPILWAHNSGMPPIGKSLSVHKITDGDKKHLEIRAEFVPPEIDGGFAKQIFDMLKAKFLKAVSVGFMPTKINRPDDKDRAEMGLGQWGVEFVRQELLELSVVPVPSNPNALLTSIGKAFKAGVLSRADLDEAASCEWFSAEARRLVAELAKQIDEGAEVCEGTGLGLWIKVEGQLEEVAPETAEEKTVAPAAGIGDSAKDASELIAALRDVVTQLRAVTEAIKAAGAGVVKATPHALPEAEIALEPTPETDVFAKALEMAQDVCLVYEQD